METHIKQELAQDPDAAQKLLNELNNIAKKAPEGETVQSLQLQGWVHVFSYRPFEPNGAANFRDLTVTLEEVKKQAPQSLGDWDICRVQNPEDKMERIWYILKKKTQQRIDWEAEQSRANAPKAQEPS